MRVLTIRQPWAYLIAIGRKPIETRTWKTNYRGPIAIHAGMSAVTDLAPWEIAGRPTTLPAGTVVAIADLVDCRPLTPQDAGDACCPFVEGRFAWVLANVRQVTTNIKIKGRLGLWTLSPTQEAQVLA